MTPAHVAADAECARRLAYASARLEEWRTVSARRAEEDALASGASPDAAYAARMDEHRRCFAAYLQIEAGILEDRRATARRLDAELYRVEPE